MLRRLPLPTVASIAVTVLAGAALLIVLASRGSQRPSPSSPVRGAAYSSLGTPLPGSSPSAPAVPAKRTAQHKQSAVQTDVVRTNPAPTVTVEGRPRSKAAPTPPLPENLPVNDAAAARQLLISALGVNDGFGEPSVRTASCANGSCVIAYRVTAQGAGVVFGEQAQIWKRLFADRRISRVTLLVYHASPDSEGHGHSRRPGVDRLPLYEETCTRSAAAAVVAAAGDYATVARLCHVIYGGR
jgi:hypothetical protein